MFFRNREQVSDTAEDSMLRDFLVPGSLIRRLGFSTPPPPPGLDGSPAAMFLVLDFEKYMNRHGDWLYRVKLLSEEGEVIEDNTTMLGARYYLRFYERVKL